ncbi:MAG: hypothetical protein BA871_03305 [Desulfuromonadales bacterium C00003096]|nr:MAG: hypothetical protein BA871_03305 [Desulfuromonadales bacterium C00003096]
MTRIKSMMIAAILLLSTIAVFTGTAAGRECSEGFGFHGYITDADGTGISDVNVEIEKMWPVCDVLIWSARTNATGYYETEHIWVWPRGHYQMKVDGNVVDEKDLAWCDFEKGDGCYCCCWDEYYQWDYQIPEFTTMAIPAIALLGLVAFYRRKKE